MYSIVRDGLELLYGNRHNNQRKFAWAIVQFYLYCKMVRLTYLYNLIKSYARAYTDYMSLVEVGMLYGKEALKEMGLEWHMLSEARTLIGKAKITTFIDDDKLRRYVYKEIENIVKNENRMTKLKEAGIALLYFSLTSDLKRVDKLREELVAKLINNGCKDNLLLWKLTGNTCYIGNDFGKLIEPKWWFAWLKK